MPVEGFGEVVPVSGGNHPDNFSSAIGGVLSRNVSFCHFKCEGVLVSIRAELNRRARRVSRVRRRRNESARRLFV